MQVSFVNSICTVKGGTHVDYIVNQITKCAQALQQHQGRAPVAAAMQHCEEPCPLPEYPKQSMGQQHNPPSRELSCMRSCSGRSLVETMNKKNKGANVKPFMVKQYLSVFINCMIENPAFESQVRTLLLHACWPWVHTECWPAACLRRTGHHGNVHLPPPCLHAAYIASLMKQFHLMRTIL